MVKLNGIRVRMVLSGMLLIAALSIPSLDGNMAEAAKGAVRESAPVRQLFDVPQRWPDKYELAAEISKRYGVRFSSLLNFCNQGGRLEDACRIAHMAMLSNQSFDSIASLKNKDNTWMDVFKKIGISDTTIREYRKHAAADMLKLKYGVERELACTLIEERYKLGDIARAGQLAKLAQKDVREVLQLKKINISWEEVERLLLGATKAA